MFVEIETGYIKKSFGNDVVEESTVYFFESSDRRCSIHSVFGHPTRAGELRHPDAPKLIRESFTEAVAAVENGLRPMYKHLLSKVTSGIWQDWILSFGFASEEF